MVVPKVVIQMVVQITQLLFDITICMEYRCIISV